MKHNLIIECAPASSEDLRRQWEAVVEGVVEYNAEWFSDNMDKVDANEISKARAERYALS